MLSLLDDLLKIENLSQKPILFEKGLKLFAAISKFKNLKVQQLSILTVSDEVNK